ncbi:peptidoglycan-binding domain-containing protein [Kitasatospora sp. NPDC085879]|uniref:peptidoglycan-binding domain-containing protein n=1 Tax=Kitasatospora sp. NPDC085879 TaxID=3154769 RepID=UPI000BB10BCC|nr:peptidoglycan-binding domain-containing protein [Streptomyces sp. TLI_235]PBC76334.1 putative peptidoglycan binding protein [Streptomyces sp. TLI_235]
MSRIVRTAAATALTLSGLWLGAAPAGAASLPTCTRAQPDMGVVVPGTSGGSVDCVLGTGNQSEAVDVLQTAMVLCYGENIASDGVFGPATKAALRRVQAREGVFADGVYGPQTRGAMLFIRFSGTGCARY